MKRTILVGLALAGATATIMAGQPPATKPVHGQGCVAAGVEASCLVVKEATSGKLYNLIIRKGSRPAVGTGIEFNGVPYDGVTMCMQGAPLEVSKWAPVDSLRCDSDKTPKP